MIQWFRTYRVRLWVIVGYLLYTLVMTLLFLYMTFPYERLERSLLAWVEESAPLHLSVGQREFLYPLGFQWKNATLRVSLPQREGTLLIEGLQCRVALLALLLGEVQGYFSMKTMGGVIEGGIELDRGITPLRYHISGRGEGLDLTFLRVLVPSLSVQGRLVLRWDHVWEEQDILRGTGTATLNVADLSVRDLVIIGFPIQPLQISQATGRLAMKGGKGTLADIRVSGDWIEVEGSGNLLLRDPIPSSLLNLTLKAMLKGDAQKNNLLSFLNPSGRPGEPIQIMGRGNLNNIQWSMDGVDLNSFLKR